MIFLLQNLDIVIKFHLKPVKDVKYFGVIINLKTSTFVIPQEKVFDIENKSAQLLNSRKIIFLGLKIFRIFSFKTQAVLSGKLYVGNENGKLLAIKVS